METFQKILAYFILIAGAVVFFGGMSLWMRIDGATWGQVGLMWGAIFGGLLGMAIFCWAFAKVFGG
jgi:hypothetical protein